IYEGLAREIYEEMAVKVKPADLQLVTGYAREYVPGTSVIDFLMVVKRWQGEFKPQDDVAALEWKPLSFINDKRFAPREYVDLIKRLAELA
ncbi:MAG TPA: hypothetical protein VM535_01485, partial [Candidatus Saccharimonadales bacterium]|nr:hypothetical protein [Candidatus Saccharimonadales bacterium]